MAVTAQGTVTVYDVIDGTNGYTASIFKRGVSAPATPTGGSYDFATGTLTTPSSWGPTAPNNEKLVLLLSSSGTYRELFLKEDGTEYYETPNSPVTLTSDWPAYVRQIRFSADGKILYFVVNYPTGNIRELRGWHLETPYNLSEIASSTPDFVVDMTQVTATGITGFFPLPDKRGFLWTNVGSSVGCVIFSSTDGEFNYATVASSFTTSVSSFGVTNATGIWVNSTGTKLFINANTVLGLYSFDLAIPWDITSRSLNSYLSYDAAQSFNNPVDICVSEKGDRVYIMGNTHDKVAVYNLSTSWDLTSAIFSHEIDTGVDVRAGCLLQGKDSLWQSVGQVSGVGSQSFSSWSAPFMIQDATTPDGGSSAVSLTSTALTFNYDSYGDPSPSNQTITLTARLLNLPQGSYITWSSNPVVTLGGSGDTRTLSVANFGTNASVTITAAAGTYSDSITISRLDAGQPSYNLVQTNPMQALSATSAGVVSDFSLTPTTLSCFYGTESLTYTSGTVTAGKFKITGINNSSVTGPTTASTATVGVLTAIAANTGYRDIVVSVWGTGALAAQAFTLRQTFAKSIQGATGATGSDGVDGVDGNDGVSTGQFTVFRRSATSPTKPSNGSYNFNTNTFTNPTNWTKDFPTTGTDPVWASTAVVSTSTPGTTVTFTSTNWGTAYQVVRDGVDGTDGATGATGATGAPGLDGDDGVSTFQATVYRRVAGTTPPTTPTGGTFNFGTNTLTAPSSWFTYVPTGNDTLWSCTYLFTVVGQTGTVTAGSWSTPTMAVPEVNIYSVFSSAASINYLDSGSLSPTTVTFTSKVAKGTAAAVSYSAYIRVDTSPDGTTWTTQYSSGSAVSSYTYTPTTYAGFIRSRTFSDSGFTSQLAEVLLPIISSNSGITVAFSQSTEILPASAAGVVSSYSNSNFTVSVWEGATQLQGATSGTTAGTFTIGTPTITPAAAITIGTKTVSGLNLAFANFSGMSNSEDTASITFPVTVYRRTGGGSSTITKLFVVAKAKQGLDGLSTYLISIFKRSATPVTVTPTGGTYDFGANSLTVVPSGWYATPPSGTDQLWSSTALASASGPTGTDSTLTWTTPFKIQGDRGPGWYRYDAGATDLSTYNTLDSVDRAQLTTWFNSVAGSDPMREDKLIVATTHSSGAKAFSFSTYWDVAAAFIDGNLLVDGTIEGRALKASTITASRVDIGDTSNMVADPNCMDIASWVGVETTGMTVIPLATYANTATSVSTNVIGTSYQRSENLELRSAAIPVQASTSYMISARVGRYNGSTSASHTYQLAVREFSDTAGATVISTTNIGTSYTGTGTAAKTSSFTTSGTTRRIRLVMIMTAANGTSTVTPIIRDPIVRKMTDSSLTVSGLIQANSAIIADAAIGRAKIANRTLTNILGPYTDASSYVSNSGTTPTYGTYSTTALPSNWSQITLTSGTHYRTYTVSSSDPPDFLLLDIFLDHDVSRTNDSGAGACSMGLYWKIEIVNNTTTTLAGSTVTEYVTLQDLQYQRDPFRINGIRFTNNRITIRIAKSTNGTDNNYLAGDQLRINHYFGITRSDSGINSNITMTGVKTLITEAYR
jgi:hypothetical protein